MLLSQYPRPSNDTGLGIHGGANCNYPLGEMNTSYDWWLDEVEQMGKRYFKILTGPGDYPSGLGVAQKVLSRGMMPIIRPYRAEPAPFSLFDEQPEFKPALQKFIDIGCRYIETHLNEPNLLTEWRGGWVGDGSSEWEKGSRPERVAASWAKDAQVIVSMGGLPGLPPCAPGGHHNDIDFFRGMLAWLKANGYTNLMTQGVWISLHNATFNHPLSYPDDDVNQKGIPVTQAEYDQHKWHGPIEFVNAERLRGKNPGQHLLSVNANGNDTGGSNGWRKFEALEALFYQTFGFEVPVLSTEGGIWEGAVNSPDPRYWINNEWDVNAITLEFSQRMMQGAYPAYYFCTCPWLIANRTMGNKGHDPDGCNADFEQQAWYSPYRPGGQQPVVQTLKNMPKQVRTGSTPPPPVVPPVVPPATNILTPKQIARLCYDKGFRLDALTIAVAIVLNESGGNTLAINTYGNTPPSRDRGLWQINDAWNPLVTDAEAFDPVWSTAWAFQTWTSWGGFGAWTTYNQGTYLAYMPQATLAVAEMLAELLPNELVLTNAAWNSVGIAYTPGHAFPLYAKARNYGVPRGNEFELVYNEVVYTCQLFNPGKYILLWCKKGDWNNIQETVIG